jgi:hypothetical protein
MFLLVAPVEAPVSGGVGNTGSGGSINTILASMLAESQIVVAVW